uniref:Uncharacterized protein n=1 Tax=Peromyscus maniculatus bairdii TaxID=230844 RepID=A0A8C8UIB9_PERMB
MCILPNIILPKPIQYVKAKIIFFSVFLLYLKHFPSLLIFFFFHFLCFSSLSPVLLPGPSPDVCLLVVLFKNILSMPLSASVR